MEDCTKCGQTVENCECHIPDEVKHAGLYKLAKHVTSKDTCDCLPMEACHTLDDLPINWCRTCGKKVR